MLLSIFKIFKVWEHFSEGQNWNWWKQYLLQDMKQLAVVVILFLLFVGIKLQCSR